MKPEAVGSGTPLVYSKRRRAEHRLARRHALAANFLLAAGGVGNAPVPGRACTVSAPVLVMTMV